MPVWCRYTRRLSSLSEFLARLEDEYLPLASAKGLALTMRCPRDAWCETDEALLARILRNLLENAFKYTKQGAIAVHALAGADHWVITVEDTGIGIPEGEHQRVFEEFYELETRSGIAPAGSVWDFRSCVAWRNFLNSPSKCRRPRAAGLASALRCLPANAPARRCRTWPPRPVED